MIEPIDSPVSLQSCPGCRKDLDANWLVCPYCGLRLRPGDDLVMRSLMWLGILLIFVVTTTLVSQRDPDMAAGLAGLIGIPMAYIFGKAVLFRIRGKPMTWSQLGNTTLRTAWMAFLLMIVAPAVLGVALILFAFVACGLMMGLGR